MPRVVQQSVKRTFQRATMWLQESSAKYETASVSVERQVDKANGRNWLQLPNDVWREIFVYLDGLFLIRAAFLVCKLWHKTCRDDDFLWKKIYLATYGAECIRMWHQVEWKKEFGMQHRWRNFALQKDKIYSSKQDIKCLSFSDNKLAACTKNRLKLWNLKTDCSLFDVDIPPGNATCLAFCGDSFALGFRQGKVSMYCHSTKLEEAFTASVCDSIVTSIAMDGEIVVIGSLDGSLIVLDKVNGRCKLRLCAHSKQIWCVQLDEHFIFSGSGDFTVKVWSRQTGTCLQTLHGHSGPIYCLAVQKNILASGSYDCTVRLWDTRTWASVRTLHGHTRAVHGVALNRMQVASAGWEGKIHVWDIPSGKVLQTTFLDHFPVPFVALMDSKVISTGDDNVIHSWKLSCQS